MKVVLIAPSYPSPNCGISTYTAYLSAELGKLADVTILGSASSTTSVHLLRNAAHAAAHADVVHVQHAIGNLGYMGYLTFPLYGLLRQRSKCIVTTMHELPEARPETLKARLAFPYLQKCLRTITDNSDAVIVHSNVDRGLLTRWRLSRNIHVIPHGMIQPSEVVGPLPRQDRQPTVGFFGFVTRNKGLHLLIDAIAQIQGVRLTIAGAPNTPAHLEYYRELMAQVEHLGIADRVDFIGFVPDGDLAGFFRSVNMMVFPYSKSTASGALHLALAHGCVTLTSNLAVFQELNADFGCLETFELTSQSDLVAQLERLLTDETARSALAEGARRIVSAANWEQVAKTTHKLYGYLMAARKPVESSYSSDQGGNPQP